MTLSRSAIVTWSALVAGITLMAEGWVVGALFVLCFMAIAPGSAVCRLVGMTRDTDAITVIATSLALDAVFTETMIYAHVWTPLRGIVALAAFTAILVGIERLRARP
jgi:hypothetical protein